MRKNEIARMCVMTFLAWGIILSGQVPADTVILKNGNVVEGTVMEKNDSYLSIITADSKGAKTYYLAGKVSKVNGRNYRNYRLPKNKISSQRFRAKKGQKNPVVTLVLRNGQTIKGQLVERNAQYFRLILDGTDREEEFLIEDIVKAE